MLSWHFYNIVWCIYFNCVKGIYVVKKNNKKTPTIFKLTVPAFFLSFVI